MNILFNNPRKSLNKAFLKQKPLRSEIELFKANLIRLLDKIDEIEREENQKNHIRDFLRDTFYKETNEINTKDTKDLVIHLGKTNKDKVGVIIEAKRPGNKTEMLSPGKPNAKALQELVLYYLRERIEENNIDIKYLIATNVYEWYIFESATFEKLFYRNKAFVKQYEQWRDGQKVTRDTSLFYNDIARPFIDTITDDITCTHFDIRNYETILRNENREDDKSLIALQKLLSPNHLLKVPFANDSNSLNDKFYKELLHIIGLEEVKEGSKNIIRRKIANRHSGSLLENTINILETDDCLRRIRDKASFGETRDEQLFNIALELCLTWINRVLFLKLLEGQLITYHKGDPGYRFLNAAMITDFDELYKLFHQVLARDVSERTPNIQHKFSRVPYLNSSLFEISDLEAAALKINSLDNSETLELISTSILKDERKKNATLPTLHYLFKFLDAYDFASEGGEGIAEDNKTIINASVLGKVFEKINGYKDGSIFTPGFITMYMSRQSLRPAVIQKFNEYFKTNGIAEVSTFEELYNRVDKVDIKTANQVVNSLRVCDPAVGSGHFLVSALNELILIKSELGILADANGKRLRDYEFTIENDELIITDEHGLFVYNHLNKESQRVQETIFGERQILIENCLFGVDINPNSVKICRLRLWIELLKSSYYKAPGFTELETLPNIDINIKCGNSLISRYALDADIKKALKRSKWNIKDYQIAVMNYRNAHSKDEKRAMEDLIATIKSDFETEVSTSDKRFIKLSKTKGELFTLTNQGQLFEKSKKELAEWNKKVAELSALIAKLEKEIEEIKNNAIYKNAFEWRFEFPEVLNDEGDFVGFDVVIGNPPYISLSKMKEHSRHFESAGYLTYNKGADLYCLFYEKGGQILKTGGLLFFITSNSWLRAIYGDLLKKYFVEYMQPLSLLNIEDVQVFNEATVESNLFMLQKGKKIKPFLVANLTDSYDINTSLSDYFTRNSFVYEIPESSEWVISDEVSGNLKTKIETGSKLLKDFGITINFGIKTGYNAAFIIDAATKDQLISDDPKCHEIIKPILRGRDLRKYSYDFSNQWAICTFPSLNIIIDEYPSVLNHFINIGKSRLEQSGNNESRKKTNNKWFETQDSISYWKDFEKPKIVWGEISDKPKFAYDNSNYYAEATTFIMTGENLKYLLAILNSKVSEWYFNQIGTTTGMGTNRWKKYKIELLPIKVPTSDEQAKIEALVDHIVAAKKNNPSADTSILEQQVDELVYGLYGITEEERRVIEG